MTKKKDETDAQASGDFNGLQAESDAPPDFTCPNCGFNAKEHAQLVNEANTPVEG